MKKDFLEEMINNAHARLFCEKYTEIESGFIVLESLGLRIISEDQQKEFQSFVDGINKDYNVRLKQIHVLHDKVRQNLELVSLEKQRLKLMLKFCEPFFAKYFQTSEGDE